MKADYSRHLDDDPDEFDRQAEWWASEQNIGLARKIADRIPEGATVIDAGAGSGIAIPIWLTRATRVFAVDHSRKALETLRPMGQIDKVQVVKGDLRKVLRFLEADVVIAKAVLKHFGPEWRMVLGELFAAAGKRVIFTMNVGEVEIDTNPDVPYFDWAVPRADIEKAMPSGWTITEVFGEEKEPTFVADRV